MRWKQLTSRLCAGQDILITVHEKPDGDAWGSALGLSLVLEAEGYRPRFLRAGLQVSALYAWLPGQHLIRRLPAEEEFRVPGDAALIVLDCGSPARCEFPLPLSGVLLNADHHISNPGYGALNWVDAGAGATAQVLCRMLLAEGLRLSPEAATCFYIALVTDTGNFRFSSTNAETLRIASALIEMGADLPLIRRKLWENRPRPELALLREMMRTMRVFAEGRGVLCSLSYAVIEEAGLHEAETDASLEAVRSIEGVEAVALLKEAKPGLVKVSLRSKDFLDSAAFMAALGGGGHLRAAGCTLHDSPENVREKITRLLTEALTEAQKEPRNETPPEALAEAPKEALPAEKR